MFDVLRARGVAYLLGTSLIGRLAQAMSALALVRLVVDQGGSYGHASILSAAFVLAGMVGQPLLSRTIDRTGRRRAVLMSASVLATAGYLGTAATATQSPVLGLFSVVVAGFFTPPIEPALRALWPELAGRNRLTRPSPWTPPRRRSDSSSGRSPPSSASPSSDLRATSLLWERSGLPADSPSQRTRVWPASSRP